MDKKMSTDDLKQHMKATKGILDENVSIDSVIDNDGTRSLHENNKMEKQS
ncbi:MAG: hypothetical protein K0R31_573 [Clostridiales bacterium]|nr:hypothetical protein [Clostridiales bacterium]